MDGVTIDLNWFLINELVFDEWIVLLEFFVRIMYCFVMNEMAIIVDTSLNDVHSLHWLRLQWHWRP